MGDDHIRERELEDEIRATRKRRARDSRAADSNTDREFESLMESATVGAYPDPASSAFGMGIITGVFGGIPLIVGGLVLNWGIDLGWANWIVLLAALGVGFAQGFVIAFQEGYAGVQKSIVFFWLAGIVMTAVGLISGLT